MQGAHKRLFDITNLLSGDTEGNLLMDEVLNACFDYSMPEFAVVPESVGDRATELARLKVVLERFNAYVSGRFSVLEGGLFKGTDTEVATWSEDLTFQILTNSPN